MSVPSSTASPKLPTLESAAARANQTRKDHGPDRLTSLPSGLFTQTVNQYLTQSEMAILPRLGCAAYVQMDKAKKRRSQLTFRGGKLQIIGEDFTAAVKQCPRFNDLSITTWDKNHLPNMLKLMADAVKNRAMVSLKIWAMCSTGYCFVGTYNLIKNLDFKKLKHLGLTICDNNHILDAHVLLSPLQSKLKDCEGLETLRVSTDLPHNGNARYYGNIKELITALPQTVQNLGPYLVNDSTADVIMQCRNSKTIQSCNLKFAEITPEKLKVFLEFLPLEQMTEIQLSGEALTGEMLDCVAKRLEKNTTLKLLFLASNQLERDDGKLVLKFVKAIASKELRELTLSGCYQPSDALLLDLREKFEQWDRLEEFRIGCYSLQDVKARIAAMKECLYL